MHQDSKEKKLIKEVITTPYEKIFLILHKIKNLLVTLSGTNNLYNSYITDLDWVLLRLTTHSLHTFDLNEAELMKSNAKFKEFIECISDYSSIQRKSVRKGFDLNVHKSTRLKLKSFKANNTQLKQIEELKKSNKANGIILTKSHSHDAENEEIESTSGTEILRFDNGLYNNNIQLKMFSHFFDLKKIFSIDFDIMEFKKMIGQDNVLPVIGKYLFEHFGFVNNSIINATKLDAFLFALNEGYFSTTYYHNFLHGADVTQTVSLYLLNSKIEEMIQSNVIDIISLLTACLGHDLGHPGNNNNFHINSMDEIAIVYNDISVLENFHTANLFRISRKEECNIFEPFSSIEYKAFRKRIINCILATDMVSHAKVVGLIRNKVTQLAKEENEKNIKQTQLASSFEEQQEYLDFLIHLADLGHNTKRFEISKQWVDLLNQEFWLQGDREKEMGLAVSYLCDRYTADTPKSQVGFINAFIIPSFKVLTSLCPTLEVFLTNAKLNLHRWETYEEEKTSDKFNTLCNNNNSSNSKKKE